MKIIQRKPHQLGTYKVNKISPPHFDEKQYIPDDRI